MEENGGGGCLITGAMVIVAIGFLFAFMLNGSFSDDSVNGSTGSGMSSSLSGTTSELQVGNKKIKIAATKGKIGVEESVEALAAKGQYITFNGKCTDEEKKWYINMRWPYVEWAWDGRARSVNSTYSLYAQKKIIVYNPKTQQSVVTAICEAGPAPWTGSTWAGQHGNDSSPNAPYWPSYYRFDPTEADGRVAGLAPEPFKAIGAKINDVLEYGFAVDQTIPLGPIASTSTTSSQVTP